MKSLDPLVEYSKAQRDLLKLLFLGISPRLQKIWNVSMIFYKVIANKRRLVVLLTIKKSFEYYSVSDDFLQSL
jgi:hypothetical protein